MKKIKKNDKTRPLSGTRSASPGKPIMAIGMLGVLLAISALKNIQYLSTNYLLSPFTMNTTISIDEKYSYMYNQRKSLLNESSVIAMGYFEKEVIPLRFLQDFFGNEIEFVKGWKEVSSWNETASMKYLRDFSNSTRGDLLYGSVCDTILIFRETNGTRRHVLLSGFNENWGAFSTPVPHRTVDWGDWHDHFARAGCTTDDLWWYLNHTNVSAVFTVTHQWLDHPKIFSLPLGIRPANTERMMQELTLQETMSLNNRTESLLIALSDWQERPVIAKNVIANFNGNIRNKFKDGSDYFRNLQESRFALCPSGLGMDTYRAWEAIILGTIPVLETLHRKDGLYRVYDDLPVLWVDHFDNVTPSLLETSYPRILARAEEYNFAKLTKSWWVDLINSFRFNVTSKEGNQQISTSTFDHKEKNTTLFASLPRIDVCNVSELSFNSSKMTLKQQGISRAFIPKIGSIAYAPFMTKCSSTTLKSAINYATDNKPDISSQNLSEEELRRYTFFSVLRHPLERALAGFHQVEIFRIMGWIDGTIKEMNLTWWNKTCLNSTWGAETVKLPCMGSHRETTTERRLQRLNDFLDEVEEKGFWDQHIAPTTYLIATNKYSARSSYFDITHVNNLTSIIAQAAGKEPMASKPKMTRDGLSSGQDWVFKWEELVSLIPQHNLAKSAVTKLCRLYQPDVECLSYDVPECTSR